MDVAARSSITDPSLAPEGEQRIAWVARHTPVLNRLARERLADGALRGRRVAVVVHLEAKTAYLALLLADAGAQVVAAGSNPGSTQDAVCAALVARGVEVHARHGASRRSSTPTCSPSPTRSRDRRRRRLRADRADRRAPARRRGGLAGRDRGDDDRRLAATRVGAAAHVPGVTANDARCKHLFDNRYGTGSRRSRRSTG